MGFTTGARGIERIQHFESCRLTAYRDIVGVWTIGYGHTGRKVTAGVTITQEDADDLLTHDLQHFEETVNRAVTWKALTHYQFGACLSLAFNIGAGAFASSHLVMYLNTGHVEEAANQFLVWSHVGGKVVQGLLNRRRAERELFLLNA